MRTQRILHICEQIVCYEQIIVCLKLVILAPTPRGQADRHHACYVFRFTASQSYSQPCDRAEVNGSGMSLIPEWVGKPKAATVFALVTRGSTRLTD